jgi:hypothetical protein
MIRPWSSKFHIGTVLAPDFALAYRFPHAIEIIDLGGGLFAPLPG